MAKRDHDAASRPDDENPEWIREDIRNARPALEVVAELFGPEAAEGLKRGRGRTAKPVKKVNQMLPTPMYLKRSGKREAAGTRA